MKSPVNIDVGQLARWQVSIYWLHDVERFDDLAAAASSIFAVLGHSADASEAAGRCVSTAYQFADQAERARQSGRLSNEAYHYRQAKEVLQKAAMLLICRRVWLRRRRIGGSSSVTRGALPWPAIS